jgi:serine/threonine protein kinase
MLELLDKDLHHVLRASDPSSTSISFVHVANECLSAVSALHEEGFIHRDVKPPVRDSVYSTLFLLVMQ